MHVKREDDALQPRSSPYGDIRLKRQREAASSSDTMRPSDDFAEDAPIPRSVFAKGVAQRSGRSPATYVKLFSFTCGYKAMVGGKNDIARTLQTLHRVDLDSLMEWTII